MPVSRCILVLALAAPAAHAAVLQPLGAVAADNLPRREQQSEQKSPRGLLGKRRVRDESAAVAPEEGGEDKENAPHARHQARRWGAAAGAAEEAAARKRLRRALADPRAPAFLARDQRQPRRTPSMEEYAEREALQKEAEKAAAREASFVVANEGEKAALSADPRSAEYGEIVRARAARDALAALNTEVERKSAGGAAGGRGSWFKHQAEERAYCNLLKTGAARSAIAVACHRAGAPEDERAARLAAVDAEKQAAERRCARGLAREQDLITRAAASGGKVPLPFSTYPAFPGKLFADGLRNMMPKAEKTAKAQILARFGDKSHRDYVQAERARLHALKTAGFQNRWGGPCSVALRAKYAGEFCKDPSTSS